MEGWRAVANAAARTLPSLGSSGLQLALLRAWVSISLVILCAGCGQL